MRETSRDYANPRRRLPIRVVDALIRRTGLGHADLSADALIDAARRAEGLDDFGEPAVREPLERLAASIEDTAALTPVGRWITRTRLVDVLRNRLRLEAHWQAHPEVLDAELLPVVCIVGLQRTGTTLLQRLLAAAPGARALASWEALNPVPFRSGSDPGARVRHAKLASRGLRWMTPDFFAVHPIDPVAPEEEVLLLELALHSTTSEATLRVPAWSAYLEEADPTEAYTYLRKVLLTLQTQRGGTHWVLKTPHHLEYLDTLRATFPGVKVVMTHRDPVRTLPSFCSMIAHGRGLTSAEVDPLAVGDEWLRKCARLVDRAWAVRENSASEDFHDVRYEALIDDPIAAVADVHAFAGLPWGEAVRAAVAAERDASPQHRWGKHVYDAADFGLDEARIDVAFAEYRRRMGWDAP